MPTSSPCASSCPVRRAARSPSRWAIFAPGIAGGLAAWLGFTLPSALAMVAFAYGVGQMGDISHVAWLHGLKIVAVAVVAQAVRAMAQSLCPDRTRAALAIAAAALMLAFPTAGGQIGVLVAGRR